MIIDPLREFSKSDYDILMGLQEITYYSEDILSEKSDWVFNSFADITDNFDRDANWWRQTKTMIKRNLHETGYKQLYSSSVHPLKTIEVLEYKNIPWALFIDRADLRKTFHLYNKKIEGCPQKLLQFLSKGLVEYREYSDFVEDNEEVEWTFIPISKVKLPKNENPYREQAIKLRLEGEIHRWVKNNCEKFSYIKFKDGYLFEKATDATGFIMIWC